MTNNESAGTNMKLPRQRPNDFNTELEPTCRNEPGHKCNCLKLLPTPNTPSIYGCKNYKTLHFM